MIGIAVDQEMLDGAGQEIKSFFEQEFPGLDWSNGKEGIKMYHLLTMSFGLDAIDFGLDRNAFASEDSYQNEPDWTRRILSAPMVYPPSIQANYGSGNLHLLAPILTRQIKEPLEFYIHRTLFGPMDISNYRLQTNNEHQVFFGGGWYLTPRDLLRYGQLYLNGGIWEDQRLLSASWIEASMNKHTVLANARDRNTYGYLFWHQSYPGLDQPVRSIECRGAGGQYLFLLPELKTVVVITSGNYRNGKTQ